MKIKLDENFGTRTIHIFREAGHETETVVEEALGGASDERIFEVCVQERRCLITLDLDFADVLRFPPHMTAGVAVLRLPSQASLGLLESVVRDLVRMTALEDIVGRLWIAEPGRIRVHEKTGDDSDDF